MELTLLRESVPRQSVQIPLVPVFENEKHVRVQMTKFRGQSPTDLSTTMEQRSTDPAPFNPQRRPPFPKLRMFSADFRHRLSSVDQRTPGAVMGVNLSILLLVKGSWKLTRMSNERVPRSRCTVTLLGQYSSHNERPGFFFSFVLLSFLFFCLSLSLSLSGAFILIFCVSCKKEQQRSTATTTRKRKPLQETTTKIDRDDNKKAKAEGNETKTEG